MADSRLGPVPQIDTRTRAAWQTQVAAAKQTSGLLPLLVQQRRTVLPRFAAAYHALSALPRRVRRRLQRHWRQSLAGLALGLALRQGVALADTITVDGTTCTLRNAIVTANIDVNTGGCVQTPSATGGADTIVLQPNSVHTLTTGSFILYYGDTALPLINSTITIEGHGSKIQRDSSASTFRIFTVNGTGNLTLKDTTISGGATTASTLYGPPYGGGIFNYGGTVTLLNSTLSGNSADAGGGLFTYSKASAKAAVTISNSTISGNSAGSAGGGVYNFGYASGKITMTVTNSTVSGNTAGFFGGGIDNLAINGGASSVTITNSTLSGNAAGSAGGGLYQYAYFGAGGTGVVTLVQSLISGNSAASGREIANPAAGNGIINANSYNLFGHNGITNAQAFSGNFAPGASDLTATSNGKIPTALTAILNTTLANNGGPTNTHALVSGSPAIDAVTSGCPPPNTDQRGFGRPVDGNGDLVAKCDIGAVEFKAVLPDPCTTAVPTGGCTVNGVPNQLCQGASGSDTIRGTAGSDVIVGNGGNDTLKGLDGDDLLCGGANDDLLVGGAGNDVLVGGEGNDDLRGKGGKDTLDGGGGNDNLQGGGGRDTLLGEEGNDTLDGNAGNDYLDGGPGTDTCVNGETFSGCEI